MDAMRCPLDRTLPLLAALLVLLLGGCGDEDHPSPGGPRPELVAETLPPAPPARRSPEPAARIPSGTRLVLRDLARPDEKPVLLSQGLDAAGYARAMRARGKPSSPPRVLFVARAASDAPTAVWSCRLDGTDRRRIVEHDGDVGLADELPDGRIVYAGVVPGRPVDPSLAHAWALFVTPPGGGRGVRITFGAGLEVDPTVLPDGRVLYAAATAPEKGGAVSVFLSTVHPDGTGVRRVPGPHGGARWALLPSVDAREVVRYVLAGRGGPPADGAYRLAQPSLPLLTTSGAPPFRPESTRIVFGPVAQGHLSMVRDGVRYGSLIAVDARVAGSGAALRLRAEGGSTTPVPLDADGSFSVRVPPDRPLRLEVLDARGGVVGACRGPLWVRPNETRMCVGCHHDPTKGPPNVRPAAVRHDPVSLVEGAGEPPRGEGSR